MASPYLDAVRQRVVVFDGAMGTSIQALDLTPDDFGGKDGCNDYLALVKPDVVKGIHRSFLAAGCDVVETDTFGGSRLKLGEYGLEHLVIELNRAAAGIAREVAAELSTPERPRFVAGSIGPTGMLPSSTDPTLGTISFEELAEIFHEQGRGLLQGGVDLFVVETTQDILELKAAVVGLRRAMRTEGRAVPIQAQVTLDTSGRMLLGTDIAAALVTLEALDVDLVGLNCSTGPQHMREPVRYLCEHTSLPISVIPNAGLPINQGGRAVYPMRPEPMAEQLETFVTELGVNVVGGCCGTTPEHIRLLVERVGGRPAPVRRPAREPAISSGIRAVSLHQDPPPLLVGERVNVVGSRRVKRLLLKDDYDGVLQVARQQVDGGAHALDVQVAMTERPDERDMMVKTVKLLSAGVEAPLVVDTTELDVMKAALEHYPGRAIVNSINLENRADRVDTWLPVIKEHGAAVVAMTIDESGMAKTADKKLEVARRIHEIATREYGLAPESLIFDPQVFPLVTGQEDLRDSAIQTIEGIRKIEAALPGVMTLLGISNVSFGVSPAARRVLNSVFLYHAVEAGLDLAIVNAAEVTPYSEIPAEQRDLADDLIFNRRADALQRFIEYFEAFKEEESSAAADPTAGLTVDERIHYQILHRKKEGIEALLDQAIAERMGLDGAPGPDERPTHATTEAAVSVLNGVLLPAMKEVGDKFGAGELILPFVLQSAEVMKKAVAHLESFLERKEGHTKGKVVLATVFGDVHDIGKSLVNTILTNNGYTVYDLGKQVPLNTIIDKAVEVGATAIGLSALLVSTSRQMPLCVQELHKRGLQFPVIIGGAAINRKYGQRILFVQDGEPYRPGVFYAKDAFEGLAIMDQLTDPARRDRFVDHVIGEASSAGDGEAAAADSRAYQAAPATLRSSVARDVPIPPAPFWGYRVVPRVDPRDVWPYLDLNALFRFQWGGSKKRGDDYKRLVEEEFTPLLERLKRTTIDEQILQPLVIYGYFPCQSDGNDLIVYDPADHARVAGRLSFPRQTTEEHLCIADYFAPAGSGRLDVLPMQIVTVGSRVGEYCNELQRRGDYSTEYFVHGLAVTTAEALAGYANDLIRVELGLPEGRGKRFSWGYGACPNLQDQEIMFRVLPGEQIGVTLTEGFQLSPDQSTAAFIVHHPEAKYFSTYQHGGAKSGAADAAG